MTFAEKLNNAWRKNDSMVCVGLDPDLKKLPAVLKDEKYPSNNISQCCDHLYRTDDRNFNWKIWTVSLCAIINL